MTPKKEQSALEKAIEAYFKVKASYESGRLMDYKKGKEGVV